MIQLRLILFGAALIGGIGLAVYTHFKNQQRHQQQHSYSNNRSDDDQDSDRNVAIGYGPPSSTTRRRKSKPKDSTCSICLCNVPLDLEKQLECGHVFHSHCINVWFNMQHTSCPNCRKNVSN